MDIKNYLIGIYNNKQAVSEGIHGNKKIDYMGLFGYNAVLSAIEAGILAILGGFQIFVMAFVIMYMARLSSTLVPILSEIIAVKICKADIKVTEIINIQPYLWSLSTLMFCVMLILPIAIYLLSVVGLIGIFIKSRYYSEMGHVNFNKIAVIIVIASFVLSILF